jgi:hypothetical protein
MCAQHGQRLMQAAAIRYADQNERDYAQFAAAVEGV